MKAEVDYLPVDYGGPIIKKGPTRLIPSTKVAPSPDINGLMPNTNLSKVSHIFNVFLHLLFSENKFSFTTITVYLSHQNYTY